MAVPYEIVQEAAGAAPWLVMVHGMSQDRRVFSAQVAAFRADYRILLVDLPGHGLAAGVAGPFGHRELAAHVGGALDQAGIARCHYWGTHTGTALGLLLASATPERFASLILEGVVLPGHAMASVEAAFARARETAKTQGVAVARRQWFEETDFFAVMRRHPKACRAGEHGAMIAAFSGAPWLETRPAAPVASIDRQIASLDLPVLLYNGAHDLADFVAAADRLEAMLVNGRRAEIPEAGGFPAWEFPVPVNKLVADFLASVAH